MVGPITGLCCIGGVDLNRRPSGNEPEEIPERTLVAQLPQHLAFFLDAAARWAKRKRGRSAGRGI